MKMKNIKVGKYVVLKSAHHGHDKRFKDRVVKVTYVPKDIKDVFSKCFEGEIVRGFGVHSNSTIFDTRAFRKFRSTDIRAGDIVRFNWQCGAIIDYEIVSIDDNTLRGKRLSTNNTLNWPVGDEVYVITYNIGKLVNFEILKLADEVEKPVFIKAQEIRKGDTITIHWNSGAKTYVIDKVNDGLYGLCDGKRAYISSCFGIYALNAYKIELLHRQHQAG